MGSPLRSVGLQRDEASNRAESCCGFVAARAGEGAPGAGGERAVAKAGKRRTTVRLCCGGRGCGALIGGSARCLFHGLLDGGVMVEGVVPLPRCISRGGSSFGCARTQSLNCALIKSRVTTVHTDPYQATATA